MISEKKIIKVLQTEHALGGLTILIMFCVVQSATSIIYALISDILQVNEDIGLWLNSQLIAQSIFIVIISNYYKDTIKYKLSTITTNLGKFSGKVIKYYIIMIVFEVTIGIVNSALFPNQIQQVGENQNIINTALTEPTMTMILLMCLVAPIVEEYVFRYGLITKLLNRMNKWVAVLLASFLFAFAHIGFSQMSDPALFTHLLLLYMPSAMIFGFVYVKEDNIIYPITLHVMSNIWSIMIIMSV